MVRHASRPPASTPLSHAEAASICSSPPRSSCRPPPPPPGGRPRLPVQAQRQSMRQPAGTLPRQPARLRAAPGHAQGGAQTGGGQGGVDFEVQGRRGKLTRRPGEFLAEGGATWRQRLHGFSSRAAPKPLNKCINFHLGSPCHAGPRLWPQARRHPRRGRRRRRGRRQCGGHRRRRAGSPPLLLWCSTAGGQTASACCFQGADSPPTPRVPAAHLWAAAAATCLPPSPSLCACGRARWRPRRWTLCAPQATPQTTTTR